MKWLIPAAVLSLGVSSAAMADDVVDVWKAKCKSCHGEDGKGDTRTGRKEKIADMTEPAWQERHSDAQIREVIAEGSKDNRKMKPFKEKLTPEEIDSLVQYIRTLKRQ